MTDARDADHPALDHPALDHQTPADRPGAPRSAGQLSDAAPARRRGSIAAGVRASWWYSVSGLVMLIVAAHVLMFIPAMVGGEADASRSVLLAVACAVSAGVQLSFIGGMRDGMGGGVRNWPVAGAMLLFGAAILAIAAPLQWSALPLIMAASLMFCLLPNRAPWVLAAVTVAAIAVEYLAMPAGSGRGYPSFVLHVFFPVMTWASVWAWDVVRRIDDARATEGRLAVARERLRFAADLHDIQGHSLQVIALKAELAERLLPDSGHSADPARIAAARAQIAEIRALAADAMSETRELVQGYRAPALEEELDNARDVLAAAGFDCTVDAAVLPDDATVRAVFGRVLREATTNVLRHAAPGPVEVSIARTAVRAATAPNDSWVLRIGNAAAPKEKPSSRSGDGSGLAGLRERLAEAGGTLEVLHDGPTPPSSGSTGRFTLTATVPADAAASHADATDTTVSYADTTDREVPR